MKILLLNQNWFQAELQNLGHEVKSCGADIHFDIRLPIPLLTIEEVFTLCGMKPDILIVYDNSIPIFITGLERLHEIPILYYAVDVHHHINWQRFLPTLFDCVLVAQKDYLPKFENRPSNVDWFPLWAPRIVEPSNEKIRDAVFVGTMNANLNPDRVTFFQELSRLVPVECMMGEYWKIFPQSRVVLNQTVKGDLNFRVFEGLMCGSALVTEDSENGLKDIFEPDTHLVTYTKGDVAQAAAKISELLANPDKRRRIEQTGREEVLKNHTAEARTETLHKILEALVQRKEIMSRPILPLVPNFYSLSLYFEVESPPRTGRALGEAVRLLELALDQGEEPTPSYVSMIRDLCVRFDESSASPKGKILADRLRNEWSDHFS